MQKRAALVEGIVAPLAGAWIETSRNHHEERQRRVAPLAGAWIETIIWVMVVHHLPSHPSRVRGLKLMDENKTYKTAARRTPRGCVD